MTVVGRAFEVHALSKESNARCDRAQARNDRRESSCFAGMTQLLYKRTVVLFDDYYKNMLSAVIVIQDIPCSVHGLS